MPQASKPAVHSFLGEETTAGVSFLAPLPENHLEHTDHVSLGDAFEIGICRPGRDGLGAPQVPGDQGGGEVDARAVFGSDTGDFYLDVADGGGHASLRQVAVADDAGTLSLELGDNRCHLGFKDGGDQPSGVGSKQFGDRVGDERCRVFMRAGVLGEVGR